MLLCLGAMLGPSYAGKPAATAKAIEIVEKNGTTRLFLELTSEIGFSANVVTDPYRVMIDMADVDFDLKPGAGQLHVGLIKQVRYGIIEKGKSRVVIDTTGPILIRQSQILPKKGKNRPRIAIDLVSTTPENLASAVKNDQIAAAAETTASLPAAKPAKAAMPPVAKAASGGRKIIVLDAGHGGIDSGALSPGKTKEKDVVLAFTKVLASQLEATGNYDVRLTRSDDHFMTLTNRVAFTRAAGADLFIAIHADTVRGQTARGTTVYTLSENASDDEAAALAAKENRSDVIGGVNLDNQIVEVADILIQLAQRESLSRAMLFSRLAVKELGAVTLMTGKPIRSGAFVVLKAADVPSVLIELGFLSSKEDEENLKSVDWQAKTAHSLIQAIDAHFGQLTAAE